MIKTCREELGLHDTTSDGSHHPPGAGLSNRLLYSSGWSIGYDSLLRSLSSCSIPPPKQPAECDQYRHHRSHRDINLVGQVEMTTVTTATSCTVRRGRRGIRRNHLGGAVVGRGRRDGRRDFRSTRRRGCLKSDFGHYRGTAKENRRPQS